MKSAATRVLLPLAFALGAAAAHAGTLRFDASRGGATDAVDQARIPDGFGAGEFSLELRVKLDERYPVGPTPRGTLDQVTNWTVDDPQPYSSPGWWHAGNFLLDGHTRPKGFHGTATREGTFSLQLVGGGRLRWTFADGDLDLPGKVLAIQAWPSASVPSLLDGEWHHAVMVRRWNSPGAGAHLELWVDGQRIASAFTPRRTDMRRWWDAPAHPDDPAVLGGWAWGSEVMTAWGMYFAQYEDFKGEIDDLKFWNRALTPQDIRLAAEGRLASNERLAAHFDFSGDTGATMPSVIDARDRLVPVGAPADSVRLLPAAVGPDAPGAGDIDTTDLRATAERYARGWYQGDPNLMGKALHEALRKRRIASDGSPRLELDRAGLLRGASPANRQRYANAPRRADIAILWQDGRMAAVALAMDEWTDLMHLERSATGDWQVVNVLWGRHVADGAPATATTPR